MYKQALLQFAVLVFGCCWFGLAVLVFGYCYWLGFFSSQVKSGIIMNIIGVLSVTLAINTWGRPMFGLDTFPAWANSTTKQ